MFFSRKKKKRKQGSAEENSYSSPMDNRSRRLAQLNASGGEYLIAGLYRVNFNSRGLIPVILQDAETGEVIKLGYMNHWALDYTVQQKVVFLYHRAYNRLEKFGEDKELEYEVKSFKLNRSRRAILLKVLPRGGKSSRSSFVHEIKLGNETNQIG